MPRYSIDTSDHLDVRDEEGTQRPNRAALRALLRGTLTALLRDEGGATGETTSPRAPTTRMGGSSCGRGPASRSWTPRGARPDARPGAPRPAQAASGMRSRSLSRVIG
ncbi:hypothetical protein ACU4GA_10285 [Methylobacterium oryzae CBMB20]